MNEFKVGLMALSSLAVVIFMSLKITSNQSGFGKYATYRTIVSDASGIFPKTPIKVAGISAGRIKKIKLQGNYALINFEVVSDIQIPKDSKLKIKTVGFLGDKYLEIIIGKEEAFLESNALIAAEEGGGVEQLVRDASEVLKDVKSIVATLKDSMVYPDGTSPVKQIIQDIKVMASNIKEVSKTLKSVITGNEEKIDNIIASLEDFSDQLAYHLDKSEKDSVVTDLKTVLKNANASMASLNEMIRDVKQGKGTLGKIVAEDEIADEVKETLSSLQKIVNKVDSIRTELGVFTGGNTDYGAESDLSLKIFPSPERFYLLGVTTSEFGPVKEKHTTTIVDGMETSEIRKEKTKDAYRFNIQIGRKIHNWSFRGGLIESSGGLGFDYDIPTWGLRFFSDFYDYRDGVGINLRVGSEIRIWNVLFGKVSMEDALENSRSVTMSAGLRFNDEDLKGLIAFFW